MVALLTPELANWPLGARLEMIEGPAAEPITLAEALDHVRALNTQEDDYLTRLITVVRRQAEYTTRRALMPQTLALVMDGFPHGCAIRVPRPPTIAIASITYLDDGGSPTRQTLDPAIYQVDLPHGPYAGYGRIWPVPDQAWPATAPYTMNAVEVTFRAGYVDPAGGSPEQPAVPEDLVHGMLLMLGELYKSRSLSIPGSVSSPTVIQARNLWAPYRVY